MKGPLIDMGGSFLLLKLNILTIDEIYTIMVKSS